MKNYAEIFPAHHTWKVAEKGFKMASMMNKFAMINSCEIILENKINFFAKNHYEIQVCTILVCTLYSIKYGIPIILSDALHYCNTDSLCWGVVAP
jgi:hypothetical protein